MEGIDRTGALDMQQAIRAVGDLRFGVAEGGVAGIHLALLGTGEIVADGVGQDEVAIGQALHQRARAQAIGAVIGEVRLTRDIQAGDGAHQVVIDPQPAHGVVNGGIDAHGHFVGILAGDALVHVEQVAVALYDDVLAQALDSLAEVEVDAQAGLAHAAAFVANGLGIARGHVARHQVAEAGIAAFQVIVALGLGNLVGLTLVAFGQRHPNTAVVTQRFAHQGELGLIFASDWDASGVNLGEAGIGEERTLLVRAPDGGGVAALGVGRKIIGVAVTAGAQHDGIRHVGFDLAGDEVARDDAAGAAVDHHQVEHLVARVHGDLARADLAFECLVSAQQQLLAGLAAGVESTRHLRAAERAVVEHAAVFAREGHALRHALIDDVDADLRQAVDVGLARAEVAALHGVIEEAVDAVAIAVIILGGVDAALRGDGVRAARGILEAEALDVVTQLAERGCRAAAGEARPYHDDVVLPLVGWIHQLQIEFVFVPEGLDGAGGDFGVEFHMRSSIAPSARPASPSLEWKYCRWRRTRRRPPRTS